MRFTVEPEVRNNAMTSIMIKPHFFLAPIITDFVRNTKRELYDEKLEDALERFTKIAMWQTSKKQR